MTTKLAFIMISEVKRLCQITMKASSVKSTLEEIEVFDVETLAECNFKIADKEKSSRQFWLQNDQNSIPSRSLISSIENIY